MTGQPTLSTQYAAATDSGLDALVPLVYDELKRIARRQLRGGGHTLLTTDLVHEAYLKLVDHELASTTDRARLYALVVRAMRQVLVDRARRRRAKKRGGDGAVAMTTPVTDLELRLDDVLALDAALDRLDAVNARLRRVVELRFFVGLPEQEIADILGVSPRTVERDWIKARLFLHRELNADAVASEVHGLPPTPAA
jgi:RNA polymerase sigma factor (TIGR02999 family)